jgi:glycerol-3-phosphate dehydrogenase
MGIDASCSTHVKSLPDATEFPKRKDPYRKVDQAVSPDGGEILCDCEFIQRGEVEGLLKERKLKVLQDILHRKRLAQGTCQGGFCVYRLLGVLHDLKRIKEESNETLRGFLEERWKGIRPVLWGATLRQEELIEAIYKGIFNL